MIEVLNPLPVKIEGAVFDMDDTLLDNVQGDPINNLHAQSRLMAVREAGEKYDSEYLRAITSEENWRAFHVATEHSIEGGVWNILLWAEIVSDDLIDHEHPMLREIVKRKQELHEVLLLEKGGPLPGAVEFVSSFSKQISSKIALATGAIRTEVDIFLKNSGLKKFFGGRIVSKEQIHRSKPDRLAFDLGFAQLGLPESARPNVLAFEDDPHGIASAHEAGLYVIALTSRHTTDKLKEASVLPDLITSDYFELIKLFGLVPN